VVSWNQLVSGNFKIIYGGQQLRGKILSRKDLALFRSLLLILLPPWK
jgi:hypothetical protein